MKKHLMSTEHSTLSPAQREFLTYTKKQIDNYNIGVIKLRSSRSPVDSNIDNLDHTNLSNTIRQVFEQDNKELLEFVYDKTNKIATIYETATGNVETLVISDLFLQNIADLVNKKLEANDYHHKLTSRAFKDFNGFNEKQTFIIYILLKYWDTLKNFDNTTIHHGLTQDTILEDRELTIQQAELYFAKVVKHRSTNSLIPSKVLFQDYASNDTYGGGIIRQKPSPALKKSKEKITINGRQRVVYIGSRGGRYIKVNNKHVSLSKLRISSRS